MHILNNYGGLKLIQIGNDVLLLKIITDIGNDKNVSINYDTLGYGQIVFQLDV